MAVHATRRQRIQFYGDVLRSLPRSKRASERFPLYTIERATGLTYPRLKGCLNELRDAGLIGVSMEVTNQGYAFLEEVSTRVAPLMTKYGLWKDHV